MNILVLCLITATITIVGGGLGYLIWVKTRPKKITWTAKVYQLGEGIRKLHGKNNEPIGNLRLSDLKPYCMDVLERVDKQPGITVYKLLKLNKPTPAVDADCVEYWGPEKKEVCVLIDGDNCTILKKGYNRDSGEVIFTPLPFDRINMIKSQMAIRKDRLRKEKDILQAITPWIVVGISMLSLIAIAYVMVDGMIEMSEMRVEIDEKSAAAQVQAAEIYRDAITSMGLSQKINKPQEYSPNQELEDFSDRLGRQEPPPSVE